MIDSRFHHCTGPMPLGTLCQEAGHANLVPHGNGSLPVIGASGLADALPGCISFAAKGSYKDDLAHTEASVVLVPEALSESVPKAVVAIVCDDPYGTFIDLLGVLYPGDTGRIVAAASAESPSPHIESGARVGRGVSIGAGAEIGSGTVIGPNAVIGAGVTIGRDCVIGAGAVIECAYLGDGVVLQAGVVLGSEGFGFQMRPDRHKKIPQLGRVIVQDRVEIGANTTVDRGTLGDTVIGEGTKIDNLVQIGHNCRIGRNCVISGMCGLSGSSILEDGVVMGGGVGLAGHLTLGRNSIVLARSGVSRSFPAGSNIAGAPAQDVKMWKREVTAIRRLAKGDRV